MLFGRWGFYSASDLSLNQCCLSSSPSLAMIPMRTQCLVSSFFIAYQIPEDFEMSHVGSSEVVVGGVFLRLLIKQPNWSLRKPKEFLVAILVSPVLTVCILHTDG